MGSGRLWLPSRRSVDSHRGAFAMVLDGHCLSGRFRGPKARYFVDGSLSLTEERGRVSQLEAGRGEAHAHRHGVCVCVLGLCVLVWLCRWLEQHKSKSVDDDVVLLRFTQLRVSGIQSVESTPAKQSLCDG